MKVITFSLRTQQPLLATSFEGDPNSDVSYSYIPGSMIRGAVIRRYMKQHGLSELDLAKNEVKRLFFDGNSTCYLNGYLQSNENQRTLPVLRSWYKEKNAELTDESFILVYDFSPERGDELENLKPVGEGFWTTERGSINYYTEKRRINIHNQRDRKKGRSTQGEGEIFRYEAIDSEQTFQAVILCSSETDVQVIRDLLAKSSDIWLGGSQSAGYGHTKITNISNIIDAADWNEVNIPVDDDRTDREFLTVTLLSDLILRDDWGQYAIIPPSTKHEIPAPLTRELKKVLGREIQPQRCFTSSTIIGGFNGKWGLPLPTVPALAAGSVFVFELKNSSLTSEQIQAIETKGIGEKRTEGFGRVAINWFNKKEEFQLKLPDKSPSIYSPRLQTDISCTLATQMAERILYKKIELALQNYLGRKTIKGDIRNSQLSRLELIAKQAITTGDCNLVLSLLNNLPPHASSQFKRAKIEPNENNYYLKQQLDNWLLYPDSWSWLSNKQELKVNIANVERSINDEFAKTNKLAEKYTLRLIMALAKKATKEENR
ncbi:RAMP superfamily CRISPR-associated protein [uncultured Nostoc sp.]|uniref:RAMP superfamily CRISPR-associated protein n=1 Tax=uncultured Nostoc sp. TaxID=340711 RepID=UPI0035CBE55D